MEGTMQLFEILLDSEKLIAYGGLTLLLLIIFAETGLFFGFIFPGDALLITAGLLCGTAAFDVNIFLLLTSVSLVAFLGNITGYATGKYFGKKLFTKEDTLFFKKKHLEITRDYFNRYGGAALIVGRFLPIVRTFAPIMAGASEMSFMKFTIHNVSGAIIWVWSLIPLGFLLGRQFPHLVNEVEYIFLFVAVLTSIVFVVGYIKQKRKFISTKEQTNEVDLNLNPLTKIFGISRNLLFNLRKSWDINSRLKRILTLTIFPAILFIALIVANALWLKLL